MIDYRKCTNIITVSKCFQGKIILVSLNFYSMVLARLVHFSCFSVLLFDSDLQKE